ncbi:MAG: hypothetical protein WC284_12590 [Candidimonas sp.]
MSIKPKSTNNIVISVWNYVDKMDFYKKLDKNLPTTIHTSSLDGNIDISLWITENLTRYIKLSTKDLYVCVSEEYVLSAHLSSYGPLPYKFWESTPEEWLLFEIQNT